LLGENFASFKLRGPSSRSHQPKAAAGEFIGDAQHERLLGAHDGEIGSEFSRKISKFGDATGVAGNALRYLRDSAIAGNAPQFLDRRTLAQLPGQSVLAPAAADHQYFHGRFTISAGRAGVNADAARIICG
jgi:hypothetical protein